MVGCSAISIKMYAKFMLIVVYAVYEATTQNCVVREDKLDILFDCSNKLIDDQNYYSTFEWIKRNTQDEKNVNVFRGIHIMMENNNVSYLRRLPQLSHVTKVSFKRNRIADADTGVFRNLPQLRIVEFGFNEFTGDNLTAEIFRGNESQDRYQPLSLEYLGLSNNRLTYLRHDLFKHLPNLLTLELNNNPLDHINADTERALHSLKKLKVLNMAEIGISQIPNMLFESIPVESLFLNENRLTEVPYSLSQSSTIRYLNLNANPIRELDARSFTKLIRLQELHLSGMKNLTRINEKTFPSLMNLEILQCSFNPNLRFVHEKAFSWRTNGKLRELYINNNALRDISETLIDWKKLQTLNLRDNPWNCTCALQWLYNLIEKRQHHDPEANIGIRCRYPEVLNKHTLIFASGFLQCDTENEVKFLRSSRSKDVIACIGVLLVIYVILQLAYFRIMKNKNKPRHSGTSIKSTVKYKPAQSMVLL